MKTVGFEVSLLIANLASIKGLEYLRMKRILLFSLALTTLILVSNKESHAQKWKKTGSLEFGVFLGASNYQGDLVPVMFDARATHLNVGILTRYNPTERFTFGLSANYGHLSGYDKWYTTDEDRIERNLHFETVLWEFAGRMDYNLVTLGYGQERGTIPYVFAGLAVFKFNPQAQFFYEPNSWQAQTISSYSQLANRDGDWVNLQPLGTEGQGTTEYNDRERYSLTQLSVPVGIGTKFRLNKHWTLGLEWGWRITFTDYIDDVSTYYVEPFFLESTYGPLSAAMSDRGTYQKPETYNRGNQKENDWYNIFGVNLTYRIFNNKERCFQF